jgi:predicted transcriptional regulator
MTDSYTKTSELLATLKLYPEGISARHLAEKLGRQKDTVASALSKLADYGRVRRTQIPSPKNHGIRYLYHFVPPQPALTRVVPVQLPDVCGALGRAADALSEWEFA